MIINICDDCKHQCRFANCCKCNGTSTAHQISSSGLSNTPDIRPLLYDTHKGVRTY